MATRIERREGEYIEINGVPVAVAIARGKRAVLMIAGYVDGLLESPEDCKAAARRLQEKLDSGGQSGKT